MSRRAPGALGVAFAFLTVLPWPRAAGAGPEDFARAMARAPRYYPLVGYAVGAAAAGVGAGALALGLPAGLAGTLALAAGLGATGMLHLDGFIDCADALPAAVPPERRLAILKDVHTGAFAVGAAGVFLLLKAQGAAAVLAGGGWLPLLLVPALARWALLPLLRLPTARPDGLGARARGGARTHVANMIVGSAFALPAVVLAPVPALAVLVAMAAFAAWAARRLGGGLTGDAYGAAVELGELAGLLAAAVLLAGCADPAPQGALRFVRDGVIVEASGGSAPAPDARPLGDGRWFVPRRWTPGETVRLGGLSDTAPLRPECPSLYRVDLGDVDRLVASGGAAPNTALAFSPDGARLAVGSYLGEVLVLDGWTGDVLARRRLAETMVKQVAWSADGATLYAAEQSPDAYVRALDPATLADRWTLRLADRVGTSPLPPGDDRYGVYSLPAAYGLVVLDGGDLLVAALHSWTDADGVHRNRSQLLRLRPDGSVRGAWPAEPVALTLKHPRVDGHLAVVAVGHSADGPPPAGYPVDGAAVVDLDEMKLVAGIEVEPLRPWFDHPFIWEALDVREADGSVFLGLGDGRWRVVGLDGAVRLDRSTGTPVMAGEVPIHASVGYGFFDHGGVLFQTSNTLIPWGAASAELRPPTAHPAENTLWSVDLDGRTRWTWSGPQVLDGISRAPSGDFAVVTAADRQSDTRRDLYGALVFDLRDPDDGRGGADRLLATCPTEGPVFFRAAATDDGRVAVAEYPYQDEDERIVGGYRVTVLR